MSEAHGVSIVLVRFRFEHDNDKVEADLPTQAVACIGDLSDADLLTLRDLCKSVRQYTGSWSSGGDWVTERTGPKTSVTRYKRKPSRTEGAP